MVIITRITQPFICVKYMYVDMSSWLLYIVAKINYVTGVPQGHTQSTSHIVASSIYWCGSISDWWENYSYNRYDLPQRHGYECRDQGKVASVLEACQVLDHGWDINDWKSIPGQALPEYRHWEDDWRQTPISTFIWWSISGDFSQFPPVTCGEMEALYFPAMAMQWNQDSITGPLIYEEYTIVVVLKEQMHIIDKGWRDFLQHFWFSQLQQHHVNMLCTSSSQIQAILRPTSTPSHGLVLPW